MAHSNFPLKIAQPLLEHPGHWSNFSGADSFRKIRSKDHRLMFYWGRECVLFSVKSLQLLTLWRRALAGARRHLEQQKEQSGGPGWRRLLLPEGHCSTPCKGECFHVGAIGREFCVEVDWGKGRRRLTGGAEQADWRLTQPVACSVGAMAAGCLLHPWPKAQREQQPERCYPLRPMLLI